MSSNSHGRNEPSYEYNPSATVEEIITSARLPPGLAAAVRSAVRRSWPRLRGLERRLLAGKLCERFTGALEEGKTETELLAVFGNSRAVVRSMVHDIRCGRGLGARAISWGWRVVVLLIVGWYLSLFYRYNIAAPNVARNYSAEYNDRILAFPEADRAWPLYRAAIANWAPLQLDMPAKLHQLPRLAPGTPQWATAIEHLRANAGALETIRLAAARPNFGMLMENPLDEGAMRLANRQLVPTAAPIAGPPGKAADLNPTLLTIICPPLSVMPVLCRSLAFDAYAAAESGDGTRTAADIVAMLGIARQMREPGMIIADLVSASISKLAFATLGEILTTQPEVFDDAQLLSLQTELEFGSDAAVLVRLTIERQAFEDVLQRIYTDNGSGDGILTAKAIVFLESTYASSGIPVNEPKLRIMNLFSGPLVAALMAGRREVSDVYRLRLDKAEQSAAKPLWQRDDSDVPQFETTPNYKMFRLAPISYLEPAFGSAIHVGEYVQQMRDAMRVAIALERYRRIADGYPKSLSELVPAQLAAVPPDRFTGGPIRYVLKSSGPLVYSVGADRLDDGGVLPVGGISLAKTWRSPLHATSMLGQLAATMRTNSTGDIRGDWPLWPAPRSEDGAAK